MSHNVGSCRMTYGKFSFMPVPTFSWQTELIRDEKQEELFLRNTLDFEGFLLETLPSESGNFPSMYLKKDLLRRALTESGRQEWRITFENQVIQSGIYPTVSNVEFSPGVWVDRIAYAFTFTFDQAVSGKIPVNSFQENWNFEENEDRSVTVSHDLSAVGVNTSNNNTSNALSNAKTFVLSRTGYSNAPAGHPVFASGTSNLALTSFEERRTESVDVQAGSFSLTEQFTLSSGNYIHTQNAQLNIDSDGISTVSLNGNIRGLGRGDVAYQRALAALNAKVRPNLPSNASGVYIELGGDATLFTSTPESRSFTKNSFAGTIDYSVSYTDDQTQNLPSGVQDFSISISDEKPVRLFASFPIMERALGNVVQDISTSTEGRFTISGNAIGKQGFPFDDLVDFVEGKINVLRPMTVDYVTLRLDSRSVTKDEDKNTISFSVSYVYTKDLSSIPASSDDISL